jgi:hypothetical protein
MSLQWPVRSSFPTWSNPLTWWWGLLALVSSANITVWFLLYGYLQEPRTSGLADTSDVGLMLFLSAAYVSGCAFRSFLPRADVQRICLFDTWLSSVTLGRSVATVAEICFAAQWAIILHQLGTMTGAGITLSAAWVVLPLILVAECFSWHAVLTKNYLCNAIENSIWAISFFIIAVGLCRLIPEFDGPVDAVLITAIVGIAGYLVFMATIDVPMYVARWRAGRVESGRPLSPLEGLRDASVRWVVTHDIAEWRDEIGWMSLYFSAAVWASLALCVCCSLLDYLPRHRTEAVLANWPTNAVTVFGEQQATTAHPFPGAQAGGSPLRFTAPQ